MRDQARQRIPLLHIGWWRGGRMGAYEPAGQPTDRQIKKRGAIVAGAISLAWIGVGTGGAVVLYGLGSGYYAAPAYVAIGALAALPVASALGWRLGPLAARSRSAFARMTFGVVVFTDVEIAVLWFGIGGLVTGTPSALIYGLIAIPFGLLVFGLPGLAMAIPSAWYWEHVMRRTFSATAPGGGDLGSGDRPR
jgi:hypothetical protein